MNTSLKLLLLSVILLFSSCIGDDFVQDLVEPQIRLTSSIPQTVAVGDQFQLSATYLNNVGQQADGNLVFLSSDTSIASVDPNGLVMAVSKGTATLTIIAFADDIETISEHSLVVDEETVVVEPAMVGGTIATTSSYLLTGDFTMEEIDGGVRILISDNYAASTALPGLYIYLTNNKNTNVGALEIGRVQVFEGAHTYDVPDVTLTDFSHLLYYCKPFSVKVGDAAIN